MIKAIFYKEWIKCRAVVILLTLIAVAFVTYLFINNANLLRTSGAVAVWSQVAEGGYSLFSLYIKIFMPLSAIVIATMQYGVEMTNKRFKLTLHLPHSEFKITAAMQLFGISMVTALYTTLLLPCYVGLSIYYPRELIVAMFVSLVPYILAGLSSYLFAMWVIIEPIWRRRVVNLLIAVVSLTPFTIDAMLWATTPAIPSLIAVVAASAVTAYYAVARFKDGAQN
ncbi:MAG: hypothetical protein SNG35_04130 [Rikenellaceae bacterium]